MEIPFKVRAIEGMPDNQIMVLNEQGILDLLREMQLPSDALFVESPNYSQAKLYEEIAKRRLAVLVKGIDSGKTF